MNFQVFDQQEKIAGFVLKRESAGKIHFPTGKIALGDLHSFELNIPVAVREVPPGEAEIFLYYADGRVCLVKAVFSNHSPRSWEEALDFSVDTAEAVLMDQSLLKAYRKRKQAFQDQYDQRTNQHFTWVRDFAEFKTGGILFFETGMGDGHYTAYWGLDQGGGPACLVIDCGIFDEDQLASIPGWNDFKVSPPLSPPAIPLKKSSLKEPPTDPFAGHATWVRTKMAFESESPDGKVSRFSAGEELVCMKPWFSSHNWVFYKPDSREFKFWYPGEDRLEKEGERVDLETLDRFFGIQRQWKSISFVQYKAMTETFPEKEPPQENRFDDPAWQLLVPYIRDFLEGRPLSPGYYEWQQEHLKDLHRILSKSNYGEIISGIPLTVFHRIFKELGMPVRISSAYGWLAKSQDEFLSTESQSLFKGQIWCVVMNMIEASKMEKIITGRGGRILPKPARGVTHCLCSDGSEHPSVNKAKTLGIKVVLLSEFERMVSG